jgi:hypothetical protein
MTNEETNDHDRIHRSPSPGWLAVVAVTLFVASIAVNLLMSGGGHYPNPYQPGPETENYFLQHPGMMRVMGFLQFGASIPLGLFAVVIVSRLRFHRVTAAGVYIALFGGVASAIFMLFSSLATWTLGQTGVASDPGAMRTVQFLAFGTGGFAHVATLGLLLAGVSVPSLAFGLIPRWACWFGLVVAAIAELSVLGILFPAASILLPIARFPALVWLIVAGFTIPKTRIRQEVPLPMERPLLRAQPK